MTTYLALLRGINVGGHRVAMERLRALFLELEFANVRSYIQSGNVFFAAKDDPATLVPRIEAHLEATLGYSVPVLLRTPADLETALVPDPFATVEVTAETRLCVLFTREPLSCAESLPARSDNGAIEIIRVTSAEVYFVYRLLNGRPPDTGRFLKRILGKGAEAGTTRFYGTLLKMIEFGKAEQ